MGRKVANPDRFEQFIRTMTHPAKLPRGSQSGYGEWEWGDGTSMRPDAVAWFNAYDEMMARQGWRWSDLEKPPNKSILVIVAKDEGVACEVFFPTDPGLPPRYLWHHAPPWPEYRLLAGAAGLAEAEAVEGV